MEGLEASQALVVKGIGLRYQPGSRGQHFMVAFSKKFSIFLKIQALPGESVVV